MKKYNLSIPGFAETKSTLSQPNQIRIIPWLIILLGVISFIGSLLPVIAHRTNSDPTPGFFQLLPMLLPALIYLAIDIFLASRIKHGDIVLIWYARIASILTVLSNLAGIIQNYYISRGSGFPIQLSPGFIVRQILAILINGYLVYSLFKYTNEFKAANDSYKQLPTYNAKQEKIIHRTAIAIIIILPILYTLLSPLYYWYLTTQAYT